ncbi:acetyl/propionyl/methylcrotonyl-CoA carboxylase subunit alpha [Haliangium ochraceum]|uniref:Carbamoyl-phosphate synthase L chain ATP-binding protein n=1 Tax=Haliangium ochraceum (strain DSM 14365 / JCM 11303 / SMP-2) TaxID=502025 RepID=D0LYT5_HALO1|nr:biotin carboxylase N-terminal domain-containing protein [Haliangium ochraceum]ACY14405.1 Carbamoyl-phosphate synthase L chain ATP- binding protein [Haliangium ochraceum DSM 14365]
MKPLRTILVANRGEIAVRILRTCRRMGLATVAVFSDADEDAPHVEAADEAVRLGPAPAAESYLDHERVLAAAAATGADAIHPGYGFLSENAAFARACGERGVVFIGPSAEVIAQLGSKREAKRAAAAAGVPVVPGYDGDEQETEALAARVRELGGPILVKASAGGGGKGMRIVRPGEDASAAIDAARREAQSAFGDATLLLERYIERPRHVEIQILGDAHGNVVHLYERECSIQRRHQKIIEEAPAVGEELRARMGAAAVAVARAVGYQNAGTVEFIVAPDGAFYFLEVNTRLQVEHPVTECVTGLDLVREQIRIAAGEPLALGELPLRGAAIECRLYAEDADNQFLPAIGRVVDWHLPERLAEFAGVRVDAGVRAGQDIGVHYDPMLAKIISHAPTRAEAAARLARYLREMSVQGVVTNRAFLVRVLEHPAFLAGEVHTHFLAEHAEALRADSEPGAGDARVREAAIAAALVAHERRRSDRSLLPALEPGFRNNRFADELVCYAAGARRVEVRYGNLGGGRFRVHAAIVAADSQDSADASAEAASEPSVVRVLRCADTELRLEDAEGVRRSFRVVAGATDGIPGSGERPPRWFVHTLAGDVALSEEPRFPSERAAAQPGSLSAPMPGRIIAVHVSEGDAVRAGQTLLVLEAMKMEHALVAPGDGTLSSLAAAVGDQVDAGDVLAVVAPHADDASTSDDA